MVRTKRVRVSTYVRNVGRSFGYAVGDTFSEYAPTVKSIVSDTKSTYSDIRMSMNDIKTNNISSAAKDFMSGKNFISNTFEDLKTGNWYNKQREEDSMNEMFGFDFDINEFGSEDWGDDDDSSDDTATVLQHDDLNTRQVISSMGQVSSDISKSVGYASARSAEYIVQNNNAATRAMYDLTGKGFNQVTSVLLNMSDTMVGIAQLGQPITTHITNSATFYTHTTETLNKMNENLETLVKRTEYLENTYSKNAKENKTGYGRIVSGGEFSMGSYVDMVKENIKEQTDMIKSFAEMLGMTLGKNGKNTSLAQMGMKGLIGKMIPQITKDISKQFNEAISTVLGNGLMRAGKNARSKGGIVSMLADLFLPSDSIKTSINPSNYEKGPLPWDGIARQSLTYVIPTYLAQMTAMMAGINDEKDYQYYDFNSGKFVSKRAKRKEIDDRNRMNAMRAGGEFRNQALNATDNDSIKKEIEEFFYQSMMNGGDFYDIRKGKKDANWRKKYGNISEETVDLLVQILDANNASGPNKNRNNASRWESEVNAMRAEMDRMMRELEASGIAFESSFYNGSDNNVAGGQPQTITRGGKQKKSKSRNTSEKQAINTATNSKGYTKNADRTYTISGSKAILNEDEFFEWFNAGDATRKSIEDSALLKAAKKDATGKITDSIKSLGSKALDRTGKPEDIKSKLQKVKNIVQTPLYAVTMAMDTLTRGLNTLFWGDHGEEGLFDKLKAKISDTWNMISEKLGNLTTNGRKANTRRKFGLPEGTEDIIPDERFPGNYLCLDSTGKMIGTCDTVAANAWYEANRKRKGWKESIVDEWQNIKSNVKDKFNKSIERANAAKAEYDKFKQSTGFGSGSGLIAGGDSGLRRIGKSDIYVDENGKYYSLNKDTKQYEAIDVSNIDGKKKVASGYKNAIANSGPVGTIKEGVSTLTNGIGDFFSQVLTGNKDPEKEKQNFFKNIQGALKDAGDEKGAIGIGAITGVGVSLLTGAVVGPLAGAAIGAGVGLAVKSQAFQNFLFGEGDPKSDDYKNGLLGSMGRILKDKKNQDILKSSGIGGGIGLIGGTLMGSPILGMITGSTIGYVAKSEKAQKWLFGTEDEKTALGELKDKIKEHAPNVAAGAIAGLVAGPFGIVGNLLIGGGLGYLTSTSKFHNFLFGDPDDKNDKGLAGKLHDKIINPIDEIMHNLGNAVTGFMRRMGVRLMGLVKSMGGWIKKKIDKAGEGKGLLGKSIRGITKLGKGVINGSVDLVGGILDRTDTRLKKSNLNTGSSVYNRELGRNETAEERLATRQVMRSGGVATEVGPNGETLYYKVNANGTRKLIDEKKYNSIVAKNEKGKKWKENSKFGKIDSAISGMSEEEISKLTKKGGKEDARLALAGILGKDANKIKETDLAQFISLLGDEKGRFTDEKKEKEKEQDDKKFKDVVKDKAEEMADSLDSLVVNVASIAHKIDPTAEIDTGSETTGKSVGRGLQKLKNLFGKKSEDTEPIEAGEGSKIYNRIIRRISGGDSDGENRKTEFTANGPIQYVKSTQGEWVVDRSDNETKSTIKKQNAFNESISGIGKISAAIGGLGGILGAIKNGLLGDGEKKEGILSKLFSGLFGKEGAFAGLLSFFTGETGGFGSIIKKMISNPRGLLSGAFTNIIGPALVLAGLGGKFDQVMSDVTNDAYNEESKKEAATYEATTKDGETVTYKYDEDGNMVNVETGEVIDPRTLKSVDSSSTNRASFSDKLKENTIRGVLTGTSSVTSKVLGRTSIGKSVTKTLTTAVDAIGDSARIASFTDDILEGVIKFTSKLHSIPGLKFMADKIDDMGLALAGKMEKVLASQSAKNIANFASNAVVWAKIAFIVIDFTTGYEDARTTLGIVQEPTVGQRVLSGLLRAIKNFIPVVGTLIPDSLVIDVFCDYIAPALGIDVDELKNAREESQNIVDQYNEANGTDMSVGDFTKTVMKDYTWTERIGNGARRTWEDTKLKAGNFIADVKENGIGGALKNVGSDIASGFKDAFSENGGGISGVISGIGSTFQTLMPGVIGEIFQKNVQIVSLATQGKLKEMWSMTLDDFSGGGEDIEGTDLKTAVPGIFSKIVGQIALVPTKLASTLLCLVSMGVRKIADVLKPVFGKIKDFASNVANITGNAFSYVKSGDIVGLWKDDITKNDDDENPLGKVGSIIAGIEKVALTPITAISWLGHKVADGAKKIFNTGKELITNLGQDEAKIFGHMVHGEIKELWTDDLSANDGEDNPLSPFMKVINVIRKVQYTPITAISWLGHKVADGIKTIFTKVKTSIKAIGSSFTSGVEYLKDGGSFDVDEFMDVSSITEDPDNPIGGFTSAAVKVGRFVSLPVMFVAAIGVKIKEFALGVFDKVKRSVTGIATDAVRLFDYTKSGDIAGMWQADLTDNDQDNPLGGFMKIINIGQKVALTPITAISWAGHKVVEGVKAGFTAAKNTVLNLGSDYMRLLQFTKSGDIAGMWNEDLSDNDNGENPVGGFAKVINIGQKVALTPITAISWAGHKVVEGVKAGFTAAKNSIINLSQDYATILGYAKSGDIAGMWQADLTDNDDGENPIGGFAKVINIAQKVAVTPMAAISWVGHKIAEGVVAVKDKVVNSYNSIMDNYGTIHSLAKSGDISGIWSNDIQDDEDNPLGGVFKVVNFVQKLSATPMGIFHMVGNKIKEFFGSDAVKSDASTFSTTLDTIKGYASDGDLGSIWSTDAEFSDDNPLHTFFSIGITLNKVFQSIVAIVNKIIGPIKDAVGAVVDTVGGVVDKVKDGVGDVVDGAKNLAGKAADKVKDGVNAVGGWVKGVFGGGSGLPVTTIMPAGGASGSLFDQIKELGASALAGVTNMGRTAITAGKQVMSGDFKGAASTYGNGVRETASSTMSFVKNGIDNTFNKVKGAVSNVVGKIENSENPMISGLVGKVKNKLVSAGIIDEDTDLSDVVDSIGGKASESSITNTILSKVTNIAKGNSNEQKSAVSGIIDKVKKVSSSLTSSYKDAASNVIEKVKARLVSAGIIDEDTDLSGMIGNVTSKMDENSIFSKIINKVKTAASSKASAAGSMVDNIVTKIKSNVTGLSDNYSGTGSGLPAGGDSGFVSQYDPRYQGYKVSGERFGAKGCGPAVAAMAANAFGKNLSVGDAVRASSNYQTSGGVTLDYFQNALGSRGINTEIISGGSSADMYSRIASGEKMILLGQDSTNTSKDNSPFGPNNHYVLATGTDSRGNIIVNDPESTGPRVYNPSILAHTKYGVAGSNSGLKNIRGIYKYISGGATMANDDVAAKVWYWLTHNGYCEQAAAAIMGNLYQETRMDPTCDVYKNGKHITCGIACWDDQNGSSPLKTAASKAGKDWKDLSFQLSYLESGMESAFKTYTGRAVHYYPSGGWCWWPDKVLLSDFKKMTEINKATEIFCRVYERPSKPNVQNRQTFANYYYTKFTGKEGEPITTTSYANISDSGDSSSSTSTSSSSGGILGILSTISSAFSNAFMGTMGSNNDSSGSDSTPTTTDGSISNPVDPTFTSKSPVEWMKSILGKIDYSMEGPRNPEKGSADCSSTVNWAIKKAGGPDIGGNTAVQLDSSNLNTVWDGNGGYAPSSIESSMKKDDVIFFSRPTSDYTKGRKYRVGHVGLYEGNGMYIDHGSGKGPKEKSIKFGSDGKIVRVSRIKTGGAGSGISDYSELARVAGGSSGLLISSRAGSRSGLTSIRDPRTGRLVPITHFNSGGASGTTALDTTTLLKEASTTVKNAGNNGTISQETVTKLLNAITSLLGSIADNTAPVNNIYNALVDIKNSKSDDKSNSDNTTKKNSSSNKSTKNSSEVDSNISTLAGVLAELAKG